jgi:hypothetical protein
VDGAAAYHVAEGATQTLLGVLDGATLAPHEGERDPPAGYWRARAMLYLGTLALRTTRAAMVVVASGYEDQAIGLQRTLLEIHSRIQHVANDESGAYAKHWLEGRAGKPGKAVGSFSPEDLWKMLSRSSHADHRAVENFLAVTQDDGTTSLVVMPERRQDVSNAILVTFAGEARDVAVMIARELELTIPTTVLSQLDEAIKAQPPYLGAEEASDNADGS